MRVVRHAGARAFLERAGPWLGAAEAERALVLGIAADLAAGPGRGDSPLLATIEDRGEVVTAVLWTPPHNLVVSRAPEAALAAVIAHLHERGESPPGVEGPAQEARAFAGLWSARTGTGQRPGRSLRLYECRRVLPGDGVAGALRLASDADVALLAGWVDAFHRDTGTETGGDDPADAVRRMIAAGRLFVWDDGAPRSMAVWTGPTPHGVRISYVYTPPALRGAGWATATVAALTDRLLGSGRRFCTLYTDLANPTSNRLYQRIGYRPICDWTEWRFG